MSTAKEAKECYISTLADLTFNSKPLINVLTMLAEENIAHAPVIVEAIESHLIKGPVDVKLPALYLIDCIIKNIGGVYKSLLSQNIVSIFCHVFQVVNEKTRGEMFKLRQTWNEELAKSKLCDLDVKVKQLDPAWPIVMPQLTNNIHLNPKFLHNSAIPKKSPPITIPSQTQMTSLIANRDLDTIEMQKNFIMKQKQLLELERMKLELELLQQQVKMQHQQQPAIDGVQNQTVSVPEDTTKLPKTQNILLKPEVAKQLANSAPATITKTKSASASGILGQKLQGDQTAAMTTSSTPRIAPVNSALLAAATSRPIRDPRLLRHQRNATGSTTTSTTTSTNMSTTVNTNVLLESKISNSNTTAANAESISTNNKNFSSKVSVREHHRTTEPRLVANKDSSIIAPHQANSNSISSRSNKLSQSPSKRSSIAASKLSPVSSDSSPSSMKTLKANRVSSKSSSSLSSGSSGGGSSTSLLDSPSKKANGGSGKNAESKMVRPLAISSSKHKKKEISSSGDTISLVRNEKKKASSKQRFSGDKVDKETKSTPSPVKQDSSPTSVFKEVKGSKSRNYIRRNRQPSLSPELVSMDVDLRSSAAPPEKQPRLQPDTAEEKVNLGSATDLTTPSMDVDLRQLPAIIGKKRPSTESSESISVKKSKMEVFDELFGNEDTDLRQLPGAMSSPKVQDRPPTPPPPIISSKSKSDLDDSNDVKIISPKSSNLDLVREKLANATIRNKLNSKFSMTGEQRKSLLRTKLQPSNEDVDLRTNLDDSFNKILISPADEQCIRAGNMTKEQETALMNKILAQIESQKLKEAKRTEESTGNISLQPISDDELEADFSGSSDEETAAFRSNVYADKDERVPPPAPHIKVNDNFGSFPRNNMDMRRGMWRGNRPRRGIIPGRGMRMMRPPGPPENWIRPNWRPMAPGFGKHPPVFNPEVLDIDNVNNSNVDMYDQNSNQGMSSMQETPEIMIVDCANQDNVKSIVIDNESRDIRYYNDTAVVFMSSSDPREISFQNGSRKVFFGENDVTIVSFNEPYKDVNVNGIPHKVKLGGPSRELHVDDKWYECFIGGPGIRIELDGEFTMVKIEGPPPQVKIGQTKRTDLVAGKINLIVDAKTMIPVFLDAKLQTFDINGQTHTLKFVNSLQMALIDDTPFDIEFGGLPKPIVLHDKKYYIRFSVLPRGIKPGQVNIQDMESITLSVDPTEPVLPVINKRSLQKGGPNSPDRNSNSPLSIQNLLQQQNLSSNLDTLSSLMASSLMPSQSSSGLNSSSYQVENDVFVESSSQNAPEIPATTAALTSTNILPPSLNINELFQKLVATGIVTTMQENQPSLVPQTNASVVQNIFKPTVLQKKESLPQIKPVMFAKPETLKVRQSALIMTLYSGMQCSSCGMRFPPEHSMQYSQHLDWHFRQNRKGKRNIRKASSRRWYYSLSDWKNYEEIEDLEEREKSYFENQQQSQAEGAPDEAEEEIEIPSVPADPTVQDARCEVCQDRFDQFYNEEKEEWHLRMAIRIDGKNYHPVCYEDYQASLMDTTYDEIQKDSDKIDEIIPGLEVASDDINKDVDSSEPTEIVIDDDESEQTDAIDRVEDEDSKSQEVFPKMEEEDEDGEDDDVIINEVVPEKIDLVDDDKYEDMQPHEPTSIVVKEEPVDDGFVDVEGGVIKAKSITDVKIKTEPIDPDDELQITGEEQLDSMKSHKQEAHHTEVVTFIDGNVEFDSSVPPTGGISGKIKINITKPLPVIAPKENTNKELSSELEKTAESIDPSQPLPPGEEPIQLNLKPALQGVKLKKIPPVKKGTELTGLCSIM